MLDQRDVLKALQSVKNPKTGKNIVSAGMVSGVQIDGNGQVLFMIEVNPKDGPQMEPLRQQAESTVAKLKGVHKVTAVLTAEKPPQKSPPVNDPHRMEKNPRLKLPIKNIIAVASGKGGVGKSTIAAAIAKKLAENSQISVGLLDADIYGPSQPKLMGLEGCKPELSDEKQIIPPKAYGIKTMSIGFMIDADKALVWRGPMVQSAIYQLFRDVQWEDEDKKLDILIVDLPPGTGDAQLTLAQKVPVTGAVIVSTPQDIALADARKAFEMFQATNVPVLGVIENMSTHICSHCGHEEHIFGHGGARAESKKLGLPFLGEIPLSADIRQKADTGQPFEMNDEIIATLMSSLQ